MGEHDHSAPSSVPGTEDTVQLARIALSALAALAKLGEPLGIVRVNAHTRPVFDEFVVAASGEVTRDRHWPRFETHSGASDDPSHGLGNR